MNFSELVTSSVLARALAIIILALTFVAAIIVATVDLLQGKTLPSEIYTIIGTGLGAAGAVIGINFGVVLQPSPPPIKTPTSSPIPTTPGGQTNVI